MRALNVFAADSFDQHRLRETAGIDSKHTHQITILIILKINAQLNGIITDLRSSSEVKVPLLK